MSGDPLNLIRLRPSKGETVIATVPSFCWDGFLFWSPVTRHRFRKLRPVPALQEGENMADDQNCFRCGQNFESNQLNASPSANRFCPTCWSAIQPRIEILRKCPVDGAEMKKRVVADAVII